MTEINSQSIRDIIAGIQALRDDIVKNAFVPMTPDMPPGGGQAGNDGPQSGMPPGARPVTRPG